MFFDLAGLALKRDVRIKELPPVPETKWQRPAYLPELRGCSVIGVDVETRENDFDHGPGWARGTGHIVGISVAGVWPTGERRAWYFPIRHTVEQHDNMEPGHVLAWARTMLTTDVPKVGANLLYDYGHLASEDIWLGGELIDIQFAEALIDESEYVALDILSKKYLGVGKATDGLKEWILRAYNPSVSSWRGEIFRTPPRLVGSYAEADAYLPVEIYTKQYTHLVAEGLLDLFRMECDSIPMYVKMRMPGVTVDVAGTEKLAHEIKQTIPNLYSGLAHNYGVRIDSVNSATQLAKLFDAQSVPYPRTATGKPSFRKEFLKGLNHPLGEAINTIREHEKILGTFLESYILNRHSNGRIYCSFHPLKGDDNGTKTGRLSSSDPNLQNVSVRSELGRKVRAQFIPDYGHKCWHKKDQSQIEYRLFAHYAVGPGAEDMRLRYKNNPDTDYHKDTMEAVAPAMGKDLPRMTKEEIEIFRRPIKNINFGLLYGQNAVSLAYKAGMGKAEAEKFVAVYHQQRPFVRSTMNAIMSEVHAYGYVTTLLNRRTRFEKWESTRFDDRGVVLDLNSALDNFGGNIRRAFAYRAVNYRFQGSAADVMKKGMLDCYKSGVFDYVGMPKLQVHDELDWSMIDDSAAQLDAYNYINHVLETTIPVSVPLRVDSKSGVNWAVCG